MQKIPKAISQFVSRLFVDIGPCPSLVERALR
jgi:hypothetical protein